MQYHQDKFKFQVHINFGIQKLHVLILANSRHVIFIIVIIFIIFLYYLYYLYYFYILFV
jgi:hypothetical protein